MNGNVNVNVNVNGNVNANANVNVNANGNAWRIVAVLAFVLSQLLGGGLGVRLADAAPGEQIAADSAKGTPAVAHSAHRQLHRVFVHASVILPPRVGLGDRATDYRLLGTPSHDLHLRTWRRTGAGPRAPPR